MSRGSKIKKLQENQLLSGRGQGNGRDYIPFIQAHDNKVASKGWLTRHLGWKTKRIHHTLSNHERMYLYFLEWVDEVVDIREQFPLLPLERTQEIAHQLGIKHAHVDGVPVVMTTDFVITLKTSKGLIDIVRTVKPASKLTKRTLELFEIEKRFFMEQGISWGIILGNQFPKELIRVSKNEIGRRIWNLSSLYNYLEKMPETEKALKEVVELTEQFQIRRIKFVARCLRETKSSIKEWELVRASGLKKKFAIKHEKIIEQEASVSD